MPKYFPGRVAIATSREIFAPILWRVSHNQHFLRGNAEVSFNTASTFFIGMHPLVRRDLPLIRQLDHADRRLVATCAAGPASEGRLQLPDRRITRPADGIKRQARPCFTSAAFDLQPTRTAIQALADRWAWLRWPTIAFHADRPRFRLSAIRRTGGLPGFLPGALGAYVGAHDPAAPDYLSRFGAHGRPLQRHHPGLAIHDPLRQASGGALPLGQATAALSGKCCNRWNSRHGEASNPHFRPMPPKPPGRKKTCLQVGGPSLKTWGRFGLLDRRRRPCTSTALLPRRRS